MSAAILGRSVQAVSERELSEPQSVFLCGLCFRSHLYVPALSSSSGLLPWLPQIVDYILEWK